MPIEPLQARFWLMVLGLTVLYAAVSLWPQHQHQLHLQQRIGSAQAKLQTDRAEVSHLPALQEEIRNIERELNANPRRVPVENDVAELLRKLCAMINELGLTDQQMVTHPIQHGPEYSLMPLRVDFKGRFPEVFELVQKVESLPRLVRLTKLVMGRDNHEARSTLTVSMELSAVFAPPKEVRP